jgi:Tn3 transposase DDE domain
MCVFSQLMWDLKSRDLHVEGSDHYADYRDQLISWSRYQQELADYGKLVELPTEGKAFVAHVRAWLEERARQTDTSFPNEHVRIEKGEPIMRPLEKKPVPEGLAELEALHNELFSDTVYWDLIETHLPDMLRVVLSVTAGMIRPSTLLRKLGTYTIAVRTNCIRRFVSWGMWFGQNFSCICWQTQSCARPYRVP